MKGNPVTRSKTITMSVRNGHRNGTHSVTERIEMSDNSSLLTWKIVTYFAMILVCISINNRLPYPKTITESSSGDFTEENARNYLNAIVGVGARPAGSYENDVLTVNYILDTVAKINSSSQDGSKIMEVDVQRATGSFFMPFLDDFTSVYSNITNTVIKVTSPGADENALLLNCHTDSVMNAPGASDDAVACAILLEILRAVMHEDTPLLHPLILLFNGAEENILQASHGFITQHKWAKQVKAFINLEAAGAGGKEYIFQTGPENPWLVWTWAKKTLYPAGSCFGQDLFQTGLIPADTDFRIFRDYGDIPGIDLAYIRNGYVYHTMHDTPAMIHPGSIQRAGENILSVARHLIQSKESLIANTSEYKHGDAAYFDIFGFMMVVIPMRILNIFNCIVVFGVVIDIIDKARYSKSKEFTSTHGYLKSLAIVVMANWISLLLCVLSLGLVAFIVTVTGKSLFWYVNPIMTVFLYIPAGCMGYFVPYRYTKFKYFKVQEHGDSCQAIFGDAVLVQWAFVLFLLRNVGSSYMLSIPLLFLLLDDFVNKYMEYFSKYGSELKLVLNLILFVPTTLALTTMMQVGVLLFGLAARAGSDLPPEVLMVVLYTAVIFICFTPQMPSIQNIESMKWFYIAGCGLIAATFAVSFTPYGFPYDNDPISPSCKRFYMQHVKREFYDFDKKLEREDSGMFICHLDYFSKEHHLGPNVIMEAENHNCTGMYCEMPFLLPIQNLIQRTEYVPVLPPPTASTTDIYPLDIQWEGQVVKTEEGKEVLLQFSVVGPPDMTLHIGPVHPRTLIGWSFKSKPWLAHSKYAEKESYFILRGAGIVHPVWEFWLLFSLPDPEEKGPILELALTAQYKPSGPVSSINHQTPQLEDITSQLNDWVAPMTWVSLYRNYKI